MITPFMSNTTLSTENAIRAFLNDQGMTYVFTGPHNYDVRSSL